MSDIESFFDLANHVGFDVIDREVAVWIEQGVFDDDVTERAESLGITMDERAHSAREYGEQHLQWLHRRIHPNGPYGWEFCARCS